MKRWYTMQLMLQAKLVRQGHTSKVEKRADGGTGCPTSSLQLLALLVSQVRSRVKGGPLQHLPAAHSWHTQHCNQPLHLHAI